MTRRNNDERQGAMATGDGSPAAASMSAMGAPSELSFVVPTEFVELPSRGRYYDEAHPLHNQEELALRNLVSMAWYVHDDSQPRAQARHQSGNVGSASTRCVAQLATSEERRAHHHSLQRHGVERTSKLRRSQQASL